MGKAMSVGERKRRKRGRPKADGVEREANGRASRRGAQYVIPEERREVAMRVVIEARCRQLGWEPTPTAMREASAEHLGCHAGRAIRLLARQKELWQTICRIRATFGWYWSVHGLPNPFPRSAALEVLPDAFGSQGVEIGENGPSYDDRTIEERSRASTAAMMRIEGALMRAGAVGEVKAVVLRDEPVRDLALFVTGLMAIEQALVSG